MGHSYSLGIVISYITKTTRSEPRHPLLLPMPGRGTYFHESHIFITEILAEFFLLVLLLGNKTQKCNHIKWHYPWLWMFWLSSRLCCKLYDKYCDWSHLHRWVFQRFSTGASCMKAIQWWIQGRGRYVRAPLGPISYIFMQFSAKLCQIICWRTPTPPGLVFPTGKSWIRHWKTTIVFHRSTSIVF